MLSTPYGFLDGKSSTVIWALIYGYIPYFILPLYAALDRIDRHYLEAARDLGASPFRAFVHVTLPLSKAGVLGGMVLIAPADVRRLLHARHRLRAPRHSMIGQPDRPLLPRRPAATIGAAITIVLSAFLVVVMGYYMWTISPRDPRPAGG